MPKKTAPKKGHNTKAKTLVIEGSGRYKTRPRAVVVAAPASSPPASAPGSDYDSIGGKIGAFVGNGLQSLIKRITGFGEYKIDSNTIMNRNGQPPQFLTQDGGVRVAHREYLGDISSSASFAISSYPINAGSATTFPFLSRLAQNFEEYSIKGLVFQYVPTSGEYVGVSNLAMGSIIFATSYDPDAPLFADRRIMESTLFVDSARPSHGIIHPVECNPETLRNRVLKVRTAATALPDSLDDFDLGNFQVGRIGSAATYNAGELWVTYDVVLQKPRLSDLNQFIQTISIADGGSNPPGSAGQVSTGGILMGTAPTYFATGSVRFIPTATALSPQMALPLSTQGQSNFYFPPGRWLFYYYSLLSSADTWTGNFSTTVTPLNGATTTSVALVSSFPGGTTLMTYSMYDITAATTGSSSGANVALSFNGVTPAGVASVTNPTTANIGSSRFIAIQVPQVTFWGSAQNPLGSVLTSTPHDSPIEDLISHLSIANPAFDPSDLRRLVGVLTSTTTK